VERFARRIEENNKRRAEAEAAAREAALEQQKIDAQMQRDKLLQQFEQANTGQRAGIAANQAYQQFGYSSQLDKQQQQGQRQRDELQNRFASAQARQQAREQELRDQRQFGFAQQENATQFQNQLFRDDVQQGYSRERDQFQDDATLKRDAMQFGYGALRDQQQQQNTLQRDAFQNRTQRERDQLLNQFSTQADERQWQNQAERDERLNEFSVQGDYRQQGFNQESMYQREAADISARWQEQVAQARNAGLDFSEQQRKEMQDLDASFRKNVINGPYPEDLKQQAMVEHQKKLSAIIPNERVQDPAQQLQQSLLFDDRLPGVPFMMSQDAKGNPRFDPISLGGGQDRQAEAEQKKAEQQQQAAQKAEFDRLKQFDALVDRLSVEIDPVTEERVYKTRDDAVREAMNRFSKTERRFRDVYGLPPLEPYQAEIDAIRAQKEQESEKAWLEGPSRQAPQDAVQQRVNPYRQQPQGGIPTPGVTRQPAPPPPPKPVSVSATNIDEQMNKLATGGDVESAAALRAVKDITAKHGGAPPDGSEDQAILDDAVRFLEAKGVSISANKSTRVDRSKRPDVSRPHPWKL